MVMVLRTISSYTFLMALSIIGIPSSKIIS
jgi:hypothetical protein